MGVRIRFSRATWGLLLIPVGLLLVRMRCDHLSLPSGTVVSPSLLQVNVAIAHSTDYDGRTNETVEAFIQDENGETVANAQIQIKVNGKALSLNNGSSSYYGAYPYYRATDSTLTIGTDTTCTVTVVVPDGTEHILGTLQTQPALTPVHFSPPATHSRRLPLTLSWQNLEPHNWLISRWKRWQGETSVTELKLSKSNRTVDRWGNIHYGGESADVADYRTIPIGAGSGAATIPASYLAGPPHRFNTLDLLVSSEKRLEVDTPFLKGSTISSSRSRLYRIAVTD